MDTLIDRSIKDIKIKLLRKLSRMDWDPIIAEVYCLRLCSGQVYDIEVRITPLADPVLGQAAGIVWVVDEAAFEAKDDTNAVDRPSGGQ